MIISVCFVYSLGSETCGNCWMWVFGVFFGFAPGGFLNILEYFMSGV